MITQSITVGIYDQNDVITLANFQVQLLANQAQRNAAAADSANYSSTPLETPPAAPPAPAVVTTTGPLVQETPTSAPALVTTAAAVPTDLEVIDALRAYVTAKGSVAARALLDKYKATRVGDVTPADLPAFFLELTS